MESAAAIAPATVDCSVSGNCFTISGAENTATSLSAATDINGVYTKTAHACNGKVS